MVKNINYQQDKMHTHAQWTGNKIDRPRPIKNFGECKFCFQE